MHKPWFLTQPTGCKQNLYSKSNKPTTVSCGPQRKKSQNTIHEITIQKKKKIAKIYTGYWSSLTFRDILISIIDQLTGHQEILTWLGKVTYTFLREAWLSLKCQQLKKYPPTWLQAKEDEATPTFPTPYHTDWI